MDVKILKAAQDELVSSGYSEFSMESVADRASIPKSSLYRRFKGSEDLISAVLTSDTFSPSELPHSNDPVSDLFRAAGAVARHMAQPYARIAFMGLLTSYDISDTARSVITESLDLRREMLLSVFRRAQDFGVIRPDLPLVVVADALIGMCLMRASTGMNLDSRHTSALLRVLLGGAATSDLDA